MELLTQPRVIASNYGEGKQIVRSGHARWAYPDRPMWWEPCYRNQDGAGIHKSGLCSLPLVSLMSEMDRTTPNGLEPNVLPEERKT